MTHEEIILNCCYLTNFLAMRKSDFHMTHVEIIFKLLLFDNFFDLRSIFLKTCQIEAQNCLVNFYRNTISEWAVRSIRKSYISAIIYLITMELPFRKEG